MLVVADFPDGHVWLVEDRQDVIQELTDRHPGVVVDGFAVFVVEVDGVHQFAVNVELLMKRRAVADAHRFGAFVPV